jgi:hypothetical protein
MKAFQFPLLLYNKKIMDEVKIIGLDLLHNPQKTKKKKKTESSSKNKIDVEKHKKDYKNTSSVTPMDKFKILMKAKIEQCSIPLEKYEKSDPYKIHLESCFYYFNKNLPKEEDKKIDDIITKKYKNMIK